MYCVNRPRLIEDRVPCSVHERSNGVKGEPGEIRNYDVLTKNV